MNRTRLHLLPLAFIALTGLAASLTLTSCSGGVRTALKAEKAHEATLQAELDANVEAAADLQGSIRNLEASIPQPDAAKALAMRDLNSLTAVHQYLAASIQVIQAQTAATADEVQQYRTKYLP